jgi:hypothetical protein
VSSDNGDGACAAESDDDEEPDGGAAEGLHGEWAVYEALMPLQRRFIPACFGLLGRDGDRYLLLEDCGARVTSLATLTPLQKYAFDFRAPRLFTVIASDRFCAGSIFAWGCARYTGSASCMATCIPGTSLSAAAKCV